MFVPCHCDGFLTRSSPILIPMPHILSFAVASAITLSPVLSKSSTISGDFANFWYTASKATAQTISDPH